MITDIRHSADGLHLDARRKDRIDSLWTRFYMARHDAQAVGAGVQNFHTLSTILLHAIGISRTQMLMLLQPFAGRLPQNQAHYEQMVNQLRSMGHIMESTPGNIGSTLNSSSRRGGSDT